MSPGPLVRAEEAKRNPDSYFEGYPDLRWDHLTEPSTALVTVADFKRLDTYSTSIPTGVCAGKVWKAGPHTASSFREKSPLVPGAWFLGCFEDYDPPRDDAVIQRFYPLVVDRT